MDTRTTRATRKITADDANLIIQTIRVTIHTTGKFFEGDTRSGNHASIYLLIEDGSSIRLNMIKAGPTDRMGTYDPKYCNYHDSTSSIRNFDVQATSGLTVNHVLSLVNERRRHIYRLARSGVGCRFWVLVIPDADYYIFLANLYLSQTVIKDIDESCFVASSSPLDAATVVDGLRYNYSRLKTPEFEEVDPGTFV